MQYSIDGETWNTADKQTDNEADFTEVKFSSPVTGRYFRVYVSGSNATDNCARVEEFELYGIPAATGGGGVKVGDSGASPWLFAAFGGLALIGAAIFVSRRQKKVY